MIIWERIFFILMKTASNTTFAIIQHCFFTLKIKSLLNNSLLFFYNGLETGLIIEFCCFSSGSEFSSNPKFLEKFRFLLKKNNFEDFHFCLRDFKSSLTP